MNLGEGKKYSLCTRITNPRAPKRENVVTVCKFIHISLQTSSPKLKTNVFFYIATLLALGGGDDRMITTLEVIIP